jgi:hypothetical protein
VNNDASSDTWRVSASVLQDVEHRLQRSAEAAEVDDAKVSSTAAFKRVIEVHDEVQACEPPVKQRKSSIAEASVFCGSYAVGSGAAV